MLPLARYTIELPQVKITLPLLSTTGEVGRPVMAEKEVVLPVVEGKV